jgi:hypothetical protein
MPFARFRFYIPLLLLPLMLTACDLFGKEEQARIDASREADGRAIGSGCRHSGRSLEDCYLNNPKAMKAAIFAGWREMDGYMRENKLDIIPPPENRQTTETAPAETTKESEKPEKPGTTTPAKAEKPAAH